MRAILLFLFILVLAALPVSAELTSEQARSAAEAWVALVDAGSYAASWSEASALFKSNVTEERWVAMVKKVRDSFGPFSSRKFLQATLARTLPGVPDGEYAVVQFQSSFEKKAAAIETVTMTAEDGKWKLAGYFMK